MGASVIAELWRRMTAIYGHRWLSSYGASDSTGTWEIGLAGLTPEQIGSGITACIQGGDEWPPTLPAFRAKCLDIPSADHVAEEILSTGAVSPFAQLVAKHVDQYYLRQLAADKARAYIRTKYEFVRARPMTAIPTNLTRRLT